MGWNRNSLLTRTLSFVLSLILAVGLMPLPAFAEAADEIVSAASEQPDDPPDDPPADPADDPATAEQSAEPAAPDMPAFAASQVIDGIKVAVAAEAGTFPAGAKLSVSKATRSQEQQVGEVVEEERDESATVAESHTFDVTVLDANGSQIQPVEGQQVEVSFTTAEVADKNLQTQVYHVIEDEATGELAAQSLDATTQTTPETGEQTTAVVQTDGFSLYTVEFTYNRKQYVMPGDAYVSLSKILEAVDLTGEVTAAEASNPELFSVSNETGEWVVTAHQAFNTTEWLKVTINGVTYSITVTDAETLTVSYVERHWDGTKVVSEEKTRSDVKSLPSSGAAIPGGWYFVDGLRRFNERVCFTGDTHLILRSTDVEHVFERGWLNADGIYIPEGCTLSIYGQGEDQDLSEGRIDVYETANGAGIGGYPGHTGGNVEVHGGIVNVCGATNCAGVGGSDGQSQTGSLTVYGGYVRSEGGENGAGIGGGRGGNGGNVIIYGGDVEPKGGENAAGMGGGNGGNGGNVTINGGIIKRPQKSYDSTVYYNGGDNGAGIGGGHGGNAGTVTINGGDVTVFGGNNGAGIGCGGDAKANSGGSVTINGGTINATGGDDGAGIGGGENGYCDIAISGGTVTANGGRQAAAIGGGHNADGGAIAITGGKVSANANSSKGKGMGGGADSDGSTPITLGYTDETRDDISITASSYNGVVTLDQPFKNANGMYQAGSVQDLSKMAGSALRAWDTQEETWAQLQTRVASANDGDTITLHQSYEALGTDQSLTFDAASSKSLTLDLNGYTLNRAMGSSSDGGSVIYVGQNSTLTIKDSAGGGVITGGKATNGGGIYCAGSLVIEGGTIKGNAATQSGGGVYASRDFLALYGGAITGNTCGSGEGGGVYMDAAIFWTSGNPVVSGNKKGNDANNIWLKSGRQMTVHRALTDGANLCMSPENTGNAITSDYGKNNGTELPSEYFCADNASDVVYLANGEVWIGPATGEVVHDVPYVERSWTERIGVSQETKTTDALVVPDNGVMTGGWYYLNKDVTANGRIALKGDTNLILGDGKTLDVKGLYIPKGNKLTIYGQSKDSGKIVSHPGGGAAIGAYSGHEGGEIVIHGGTIEATGHDNCAGIGSNDGNGTTSPITIYGGTIYTRGGSDAAGIGGGCDCDGGTVTIYGGTITANEDPNENAAAIGGGENGNGGTIRIHGGTITTWSRDGACIGGGEDGDGGEITINGGTITCNDKGEANGARIGGGDGGDGGTITINDGTIHVWFRDGAGIGGGEDGDSGTITINGGTVISKYASGSEGSGAAIGGGNNGGDGHLITITGGDIVARSKHGAGIGGGRAGNKYNNMDSGKGGTITISGGKLIISSDYGFGIGTGGKGGKIFDTPDTKWATSAGTITIGGDAHVDTTGWFAGIGGDGGSITINGGDVTSKGIGHDDKNGRGILLMSKEGRVTITGGKVTAAGYGDFPGISTEWATVKITGGTVKASAEKACGLGGRNRIEDARQDHNDDNKGTLTIEGTSTVVDASSTKFVGMGGYKKHVFGPGITVEITSGGRDKGEEYWSDAKIDYEGMRVTAGADRASAQILPESVDLEHQLDGQPDQHHAYQEEDFKYLRYEPCSHKDTVENNICWACSHTFTDQIQYVECSWDGTESKVIKAKKDLPEGWQEFPNEDDDITLSAGCYVVNRNQTVSKITLTGNVDLILCNGYTLSALSGVDVPQNCTLNIYVQAGGTGGLLAYGYGLIGTTIRAGIHNLGNVVVHGGVVTAQGATTCAGIGSNDDDRERTGSFTVYDGTVSAVGGRWAAGIGGGRDSDGGTITIYGGTITATGKDSSAGIGGGDTEHTRADNSAINIHGGNVTATGDSKGSGIGGGEYGRATVSISGGDILAIGGMSGGAGIGSGVDGEGSDITITGGVVSALCYSGGNGIGDGKNTPNCSSTIRLGYTDKTKDEISITATTFDGTATMEQSFHNENGVFPANETPNIDTMGGSTLRAWDGVTGTTWKDLQMQIRGADGGQVIKLGQDFTAEVDDTSLEIESGKTITIDLNGHTLDRYLVNRNPYASEKAPVIHVAEGANLTIEDSRGGGIITGGFSPKGGGIYCEGTLTVNGGTIQDNKANTSGGGIYLEDGTNATLHLNGGTITGNACNDVKYETDNCGGGVYVSATATMTVSGNPVVTGNERIWGHSLFTDNVGLASSNNGNSKISVVGELADGASLGVTIQSWSGNTLGVITSEYGKQNQEYPSAYFHSDDDQYNVVTASVDGYTEGRIAKGLRGVTYLSYEWADGKLVETVESTEGNWMAWPDATSVPGGMYVLNQSITKNSRVSLQDNTWIVLCDGCTLDVRGLYVPAGKTLTIYGQSGGTGKIVSHPSSGAGIGATSDNHPGGNVVIHGGTIEATGHDHCAGIGSNDGNGANVGSFTMYNGTVTATGGS